MSRLRWILFSTLIYLAFFVSGAGCLVAEVTWNRMLIVVVGNSMSATALIVAVFMGGLGLGSLVGGKVLAGRRASLIPYVVLEVMIGLYVLTSPALFDLLARMFTNLADRVDNQESLMAMRLVVTVGALLIPAFLMGATFPAVVAGTALGSPDKRSARIGYLYSTNTLGATVGCFAAGYHLLFEFGVRTTLACAVGLYIFAAFCAIAATLAQGKAEPAGAVPETPPPARPPGRPWDRRELAFLCAATFAVGFVSLAYEVLLTRLGILYLGNSVSVFSLILTGFLLGTGISAVAGTWLYGVLRRSGGGDKLFGFAALAAGVSVLTTPYLLLTDSVLGPERLARLADTGTHNPLPVLLVIMAPTILIGSLLPIAIRMLHPEGRAQTTQSAATLYALNTAGGLLGASTANHYLVPLIGVRGVVVGLVSICALVGGISLLSPGHSLRRWSAVAGSVVLMTIILLSALPDMTALYAERIAQSTGAQSAEVKLVSEGRAATVTVIDQADPTRGTYRDMYLNGVEEASTRYWHTQLFKLLGILPVLVHESDAPKDVLVIAFGAGITAGSVLASDQVASLDVVDLNPDIEAINDLFAEVNGDVFHAPRFRFINDDGRNYLITSPRQYDLIIGDSTHPRAYDSWILYTEECYRTVRRRLAPRGIFAQWVPVLGSMQGDLFKIHLNTFRRVFPNTTVWYVYGSDQAFLLATPEPLSLDATRLQARLDLLPPWFQADTYQIDSVPRIAGFFWLDGPALDRIIGAESRINADNRHFFDKQSAIWPAPPEERLPAFQATALPYIRNIAPAAATAVRNEQFVALLLARYGFFNDRDDLYEAFCHMPENGNVQYWMSLEFAGNIPDRDAFCRDRAIAHYRAILAVHPHHAQSLNNLAVLLTETGPLAEAEALAAQAVAMEPEKGAYLDTYGWILAQEGKGDAAVKILSKADRLLPEHPVVLYHLGAAYRAAGDVIRAQEALAKALTLSSAFPEADKARQLLDECR